MNRGKRSKNSKGRGAGGTRSCGGEGAHVGAGLRLTLPLG